MVKKLVQGLSRSKRSRDVRLPITPALLARVIAKLSVVCKSYDEAYVFSLAYSLAFYGFFRVGELVVSSAEHGLMAKNVKSLEERPCKSLSLGLQSSKTDQNGNGVIVILEAREGITCPVRCFEQYIIRRPNVEGYLLCHADGKPLTRYQFFSVLKMAISRMGMDASNYNSHSFRIGAAITAYRNSVSEDELKSYGRWTSNVFRTYIRIPKRVLQ